MTTINIPTWIILALSALYLIKIILDWHIIKLKKNIAELNKSIREKARHS